MKYKVSYLSDGLVINKEIDMKIPNPTDQDIADNIINLMYPVGIPLENLISFCPATEDVRVNKDLSYKVSYKNPETGATLYMLIDANKDQLLSNEYIISVINRNSSANISTSDLLAIERCDSNVVLSTVEYKWPRDGRLEPVTQEWPSDDRIDAIGQNGNEGLHYDELQYCWVIYVSKYDLENGNLIDIDISPQNNSKFVGIKNGMMDHPISVKDYSSLHPNQFTWLKLHADDTAIDNVNQPEHYTNHPSGIECITITEHMGFNLGNAVKYIWRCDLKKDAIEDLKKARWYLDREIEKREKP